jgi:flagellar hook protein FlgE
MAFLTSLFAGVSGLKNHQLMMDVIGNNIANVNTVGFKKGRATFTDMFSQTLQNAAQPTSNLGGTNPIQVGLGMSLGSIDMDASQGSFQSTGLTSDMAIQGGGFFIINQGGKTLYTRDGNVDFDSSGKLSNKDTGGVIQGRLANANGNILPSSPLSDIVIKKDLTSPPKATTTARSGQSRPDDPGRRNDADGTARVRFAGRRAHDDDYVHKRGRCEPMDMDCRGDGRDHGLRRNNHVQY